LRSAGPRRLRARGTHQPERAVGARRAAANRRGGDQGRGPPAQPGLRGPGHPHAARGDRRRGRRCPLPGEAAVAGGARETVRGPAGDPRRLQPAVEVSAMQETMNPLVPAGSGARPAPRLSLGPLLYYWSRQELLAFYASIGGAPVEIVY